MNKFKRLNEKGSTTAGYAAILLIISMCIPALNNVGWSTMGSFEIVYQEFGIITGGSRGGH